ncbi:hypothetical protein WMF31_41585 [Sorangium sp. So ce1036]|uniref:hypothetical protein n=1 Tax=Sorangium sp. So ce1036 TaxID=3133328 RepID=UPI003F013AA7
MKRDFDKSASSYLSTSEERSIHESQDGARHLAERRFEIERPNPIELETNRPFPGFS